MPRKLLVVDDDDDVREVTAYSLELLGGYTVIETDRGRTALDLARTHLPDLVLLDVMMPELDGLATFRELRADPAIAHIPVVLLTAKVQAGAAAEPGLAGVIAKPFDPRGLVAEVDRLLGVEREPS